MSYFESFHEYNRDIESIGKAFTMPLGEENRGWRAILSGAVLPVVFASLGWIFTVFLWHQFIVSVMTVSDYQTDPGLLVIVFGLFVAWSHFWFVLTGSIVHGLSGHRTEGKNEEMRAPIRNPRGAIEGVTVELLIPTAQRYDQPIGRWH